MSKLFKSVYYSPFGPLVLLSDSQYLLKLYPAEVSEDSPTTSEEETEPIRLTRLWLDDYFEGSNPSISDIPIKMDGTAFQQKCWKLLCSIPHGKTCTYKDIADEVAQSTPTGRMSSQAVGQAIRKNPVLIIIPCHRVIGSNGTLTGYAGGLELKEALLLHEKAIKAAL